MCAEKNSKGQVTGRHIVPRNLIPPSLIKQERKVSSGKDAPRSLPKTEKSKLPHRESRQKQQGAKPVWTIKSENAALPF
jgi:hypothetical protein